MDTQHHHSLERHRNMHWSDADGENLLFLSFLCSVFFFWSNRDELTRLQVADALIYTHRHPCDPDMPEWITQSTKSPQHVRLLSCRDQLHLASIAQNLRSVRAKNRPCMAVREIKHDAWMEQVNHQGRSYIPDS